MLLHYITVLFFLPALIAVQNPSPCPDILTYEPPGPEPDRYYAGLSVPTVAPLDGIWMRIQLDQTADILGNWFAEVSSDDNKNFYIENKNYKSDSNQGHLTIRFFVKYNASGVVPNIVGISLNGKAICPSADAALTRTPPQPLRSQAIIAPSINNRQPALKGDDSDDDDDFFNGDFSVLPQALIATCGTVKVPAQPLITYGQTTVKGEWPWHAALYRSSDINLKYICGGTLISLNHILTAAHCVTKSRTGVRLDPDLFTVYLGKYHVYGLSSSVQARSVVNITTHPRFHATYLRNDIAILRLDKAVEITDFVRTVCLWDEEVELNNVVDKQGTVVGWGFDQNGNVTETLMRAQMPVVSSQTCIFSNRQFFSIFVTDKNYCAGFRNGTSVCTGDSGGGMVFPKTGTSGKNAVWQLRGVVSLSAAVQNQKVLCDTSSYVVFTDVAKYLDWISETTKP